MNAPLRLVKSDQDWVDRVRAGDHTAFEDAFRTYYPELCAFAYRYLRSPALAEEAVHDVFTTLWRTRERLQVRDSVKAYLYGSVRHRAISLLRRQGLEQAWYQRATHEEQAFATHDQNDGPRHVEHEQLVAAIEAVLADLPPRARTAVVLRWQREMSYAEIAEAMQISVKTVEVHLTRALKALRAVKQLQAHLPEPLSELSQD